MLNQTACHSGSCWTRNVPTESAVRLTSSRNILEQDNRTKIFRSTWVVGLVMAEIVMNGKSALEEYQCHELRKST